MRQKIAKEPLGFRVCWNPKGFWAVDPGQKRQKKRQLRGGPIKQYIVLGNGMISVMLFFRYTLGRSVSKSRQNGGLYMELNEQIKKYRTEMNLSQEELAEKIYVTRQSVSNWENGVSQTKGY